MGAFRNRFESKTAGEVIRRNPPKRQPGDRAAFSLVFPIFLATAPPVAPPSPCDSTQPRHRQPKAVQALLPLGAVAAVPGGGAWFPGGRDPWNRAGHRSATCWSWPRAQPPGTLAAWHQKPMGCCPIGWAWQSTGACRLTPRHGSGCPFAGMLVLTLIATWYGCITCPEVCGAARVSLLWRRGPA